MAKRDLTFADVDAAARQTPDLSAISVQMMRRLPDLELRHVITTCRRGPGDGRTDRVIALAEQELADRAAISNRWTMGFAAAGVVVGIVGVIATLL